jgi:hypothetical protein
MVFLTREAVLQTKDLARDPVEVPEWGGSIYVRCLTAWEGVRFNKAHYHIVDGKEVPNPETFHAGLVAACACDADGNLLFSEADVEALAQKSAVALGRVVVAALRVNKLDRQSQEFLEKNSAPTPGGSSSSGSPAS